MTCTHHRLAIVSLAALTVSLLAVSAQAAVVGLWTFEEYAGQTTVPNNGFIEDTSGNARHMLSASGRAVVAGSTVGSTAVGFSSNAGDFLEFIPGFSGFQNSGATASSSDIVIGSSSDPLNWSFTLEAILTLPQDNSQGAVEGGILGKGAYNGTSDVDEWNLVAVANGGSHLNTVEGFVGDGLTNVDPGVFMKTTSKNLPTGFRHIALVRDRLDDHLHFYLDGVLTTTVSDTNPKKDVTNALGNFVIGANNASGGKRYRGLIDMVRISNDALTPAQFWSNPPIPEPSSLILLTAGLGCLALRRKRC